MAIDVAWPLVLGGILAAVSIWLTISLRRRWGEGGVPSITVKFTEGGEDGADPKVQKGAIAPSPGLIPCVDPATMEPLGTQPAMSAAQVNGAIRKARRAAMVWRNSSFVQRRRLLKVILKFIVKNQRAICRVSARDSGKPMVDAAFGEVMTTCEKIWWLIKEGERWLQPERRSTSIMMMYKAARVEYHPVGVVGAIVPWNYPFHNVFNPLTAAVFAGNAIVIKVSEHASWSAIYYGRIIRAALGAVGAPPDLVQIVTGYGEAGNALVTGGVDKLIFVGSTEVGRKVMEAAAKTLTPVVLELGGKDPVIICDDADLSQAVPIAARAAFQSCGQNCAGAERFIVQVGVYDAFVRQLATIARDLRQGPPLGPEPVDCGAMCLPGLAERVEALVQDAVAKGAEVEAGGGKNLPAAGVQPPGGAGQYVRPRVLTGVTRSMAIWREEVFGPMAVVVKFETDDEAVALANDCDFGLGSAVFSQNPQRANSIAARLEAGMTSINDFATTYMCQSLPFGGVKQSGFERFGGVEGLRGLCIAKAVAEDWAPIFKTRIPSILQYPVGDGAFEFVSDLVTMFYSPTVAGQLEGLFSLAKGFLFGGPKSKQQKQQ